MDWRRMEVEPSVLRLLTEVKAVLAGNAEATIGLVDVLMFP